MKINVTLDSERFKGYPSLCGEAPYGSVTIPMVDYDEMYYFFSKQDNKIVACRIKEVVVAFVNTYTRVFFHLDTPIGRMFRDSQEVYFFKSADDCSRFLRGTSNWYCRFDKERIYDLFREHCYYNAYRSYHYFAPEDKLCWSFKNNCVMHNPSAFIRYMVIDKTGCTICFNDKDNDGVRVYLSKKECERDNVDTISVTEFPAEKTEESNGIMNDTNNHDKDLVRRINALWGENRRRMSSIVNLLISRDLMEFEDAAGEAPVFNTCDIATYLNRVADNNDLDVIVKYCSK